MPRPFRPKSPYRRPSWIEALLALTGLTLAMLRASAAVAQVPVASSYSTRDGRVVTSVMGCMSTDGSFTAKPCGVAGYPLHVTVDGAGQSSVTQGGPWAVAVSNLPPIQAVTDTATLAIAAAIRTNDASTIRAQTHDDQIAALAAKQPALNADGGAASHITNFPAVLTVTDTNSAAFQGVVAITPGTAVAPQRSLGFVISSSGAVTLTLADASTITLTLPASTAFQTLPFAVTNVALGSGAAGSFWNLK